MQRKNKNYDIVEYNKFYVIDYNLVYIKKIKYKKNGKIKKVKNVIKIAVKILCESEEYLFIFKRKLKK